MEASQTGAEVPNGDEVLLMLVRLANRGIGVGITAKVNGQTVAGDLVSGAAWATSVADGLGKVFAGDAEQEVARMLSAEFRATAAAWDEVWQVGQNGPYVDPPAPAHLHIREPSGVRVWRVRMSEVAAWTVGVAGH